MKLHCDFNTSVSLSIDKKENRKERKWSCSWSWTKKNVKSHNVIDSSTRVIKNLIKCAPKQVTTHLLMADSVITVHQTRK